MNRFSIKLPFPFLVVSDNLQPPSQFGYRSLVGLLCATIVGVTRNCLHATVSDCGGPHLAVTQRWHFGKP
ncbi:hypothetical protein GUJ93_ZPchr0011g27686 [Zizania palustris]|uniref:Uncharacterized protein n=1 Tax=Zizania palustris TaxID=103762 RepID=A0A8J5WKD3_ZIZPA|nr:hypothetical protein GUJ93_ZPchr0011g27686 [Zizania palustris]